MLDTIKKEMRIRIPIMVFVFYTIWWVMLQSSTSSESYLHDLFSDTYGISALIGGFIGYFISLKWGGWKSKMGRATMMFSFGLFAQAFGQFVYTYYFLFLGVDVPYPSIGDLGYFGSIPLYIYGLMLLADASGVNFTLRRIRNQVWAVLLPLAILSFSYAIFLHDYSIDLSDPLLLILDFGYPLGQALYVAFALLIYLLSRNILGGLMRDRILLILVALFIQYLADYTFLLQVINESWTAAGINDYIYLVSYFTMTLALFNMRISEVRQKLVNA